MILEVKFSAHALQKFSFSTNSTDTCQCSRRLRRHAVTYFTSDKKLTIKGFSQILKEHSGKQRCIYTPNSNNLKIWNHYLKKNLRVRVVSDNAYTRFSNFAIEYLREDKQVRETVFVCSYGAQVKSYKQKIVKNFVTRPFYFFFSQLYCVIAIKKVGKNLF